MTPGKVALRVVIDGRVQGVGFRHWISTEALRRGLDGWVRNRVDGRVEGLFQGEAESVDGMIATCRRGPALAHVTAVTEHPEPVTERDGFKILPTG